MILHVVNSTKHPFATLILTNNARLVLRFVPISIFLARETIDRLATLLMTTKEKFCMPTKVLTQIASSSKDCLRDAPEMSATPTPTIEKRIPKVSKLC